MSRFQQAVRVVGLAVAVKGYPGGIDVGDWLAVGGNGLVGSGGFFGVVGVGRRAVGAVGTHCGGGRQNGRRMRRCCVCGVGTDIPWQRQKTTGCNHKKMGQKRRLVGGPAEDNGRMEPVGRLVEWEAFASDLHVLWAKAEEAERSRASLSSKARESAKNGKVKKSATKQEKHGAGRPGRDVRSISSNGQPKASRAATHASWEGRQSQSRTAHRRVGLVVQAVLSLIAHRLS